MIAQISPKLLQSNVLRRIYKDSAYQASCLKAAWYSANLSGNVEAGERLFSECEAYTQVARSAFNELQERKESLN